MQCLFDRDPKFRRNHLGDTIHFVVGHVKRTTDIADRRLRRHRSERNDLCYVVDTISFGNVIDDFATFHIAKIDIDIRHRNTFGIQESLKEELIFERIDIADTQQVRNDTACRRTTSRADCDIMLSGILDKIPHDQEITGEPHLINDAQFIFQSRRHLGRRLLSVSPSDAVFAKMFQILCIGGKSIGEFEYR